MAQPKAPQPSQAKKPSFFFTKTAWHRIWRPLLFVVGGVALSLWTFGFGAGALYFGVVGGSFAASPLPGKIARYMGPKARRWLDKNTPAWVSSSLSLLIDIPRFILHAPHAKPESIVSEKLEAVALKHENDNHIKLKDNSEIRKYIEDQIVEARKYAHSQYDAVVVAVLPQSRYSLAWFMALPGAFLNSEVRAAKRELDRRLKAIDERERKISEEIKEVRLHADDHAHLPKQTELDNLEDRRAKLIIDFRRTAKELERRKTPEGAKEYVKGLLDEIHDELQKQIDAAVKDSQKRAGLKDLEKQQKAVKAAKDNPDIYVKDIIEKTEDELAQRRSDYKKAKKELEAKIVDAKRPAGSSPPAPVATATA